MTEIEEIIQNHGLQEFVNYVRCIAKKVTNPVMIKTETSSGITFSAKLKITIHVRPDSESTLSMVQKEEEIEKHLWYENAPRANDIMIFCERL